MVGEGGGEIDFLGGNRTCITYVCKKKEFSSGLEPHCMKSSALPTTLSGHTCMLVIDS